MRKFRITVLALALAALFTATALAAGTQAVGDVNGDGTVDMTDMQRLYELLSTGDLTDETVRRAADINGDDTVDILDYQRLYDILRQKVDYSNPVYEYDENGREIKKSYYDATGKLSRYLVYEYGTDGRMSAAACYNADGSTRYTCKIEYRADNWAEWTYYDPETNKVLGVDLDDAKGTLRQSTEYDPATGKVACIWEYDETGTLCKSTEYDTDTDKVVCVREFDEKERMVGCKGYENGILSFHWTAVYDEDGVETRTYYDAATNKVTCIEVFDANETLHKSTEYNTDTGKVVCVQEYDENGAVRKYTSYDRETGEILSVSEFDEQGRGIGFKKFNNGTLSFHWAAVYDESGAEIRTYYDPVTGSASNIEKREYDWTNKICTMTQYDVQPGKKYCVAVYDMSDQNNWKLLKETYYDENGNITSEKEY